MVKINISIFLKNGTTQLDATTANFWAPGLGGLLGDV
jgi:hypothetical protein